MNAHQRIRVQLHLAMERLENRLTPTLTPGPTYVFPAEDSVTALVAADFNEDGKQDLIVAKGTPIGTDGNGGLDLLLGNGNGSFQPGATPYFGTEPLSAAAVADLNADGHTDIAFTAPTSNQVIVLLGNGHGTFGPYLPQIVGTNPIALAIGDFNHDNKPDIVTANMGQPGYTGWLSVLLGNGDGTFQAAVTYGQGTNPTAVAAADFNGDSCADIVLANGPANEVRVFLANPDGTFPTYQTYAVAPGPFTVAVGDFNRDGRRDLATASNTITSTSTSVNLSILLNTGAGGFGAAQISPVSAEAGPYPGPLVAGDFTGDGFLDLALSGEVNFTATVGVFGGNGNGTFRPPVRYPIGTGDPSELAAGDFNGDGRLDLVASTYRRTSPTAADETTTLQVLFNERDVLVTGKDAGSVPEVRVFDAGTTIPRLDFNAYAPAFAGGVRVAHADFNGDGMQDIVTAPGANGGPHVIVFDGRSATILHQFMAYAPAWIGGVYVAAGDANGDGIPDIVTGAGAGGGPHVKVIDGTKLDLVQPSGQISDSALLQSFYAYGAAFAGGVRVAAGDVNGDGRSEIITAAGQNGGPHVKVLDGVTLATYQSFFAYPSNYYGGVFVNAGDVTGDGLADVITGPGQGFPPEVVVFFGGVPSQWGSFYAYSGGFYGGVRVAASDVNGDDRLDTVTGPAPVADSLVRGFDGLTADLQLSFYAFESGFFGGIFVG